MIIKFIIQLQYKVHSYRINLNYNYSITVHVHWLNNKQVHTYIFEHFQIRTGLSPPKIFFNFYK